MPAQPECPPQGITRLILRQPVASTPQLTRLTPCSFPQLHPRPSSHPHVTLCLFLAQSPTSLPAAPHLNCPLCPLKLCSFTSSVSSVNVPSTSCFHRNLGHPENAIFSTAPCDGAALSSTPPAPEDSLYSLYASKPPYFKTKQKPAHC